MAELTPEEAVKLTPSMLDWADAADRYARISRTYATLLRRAFKIAAVVTAAAVV